MDNKIKIEKRVRLYPKIYRHDNVKRDTLAVDWTKRVFLFEKYDGSNIGIMWVDGKYHIYSRNGLINFENNKSFSGLQEMIVESGITGMKNETLFLENTLVLLNYHTIKHINA